MAKNIGILGGTFNPIHYGHLRVAEELAENLAFDEVRFIPSANPPHKSAPLVSAKDRASMVKSAIQDNDKFTLDMIELDRTGASYTIDTLISLRKTLGQDVSINLIMGTDAFTKLNTWHHWESLLEYCHIVLVQRPQTTLDPNDKLPKILEQFLTEHYTESTADLAQTPHGFVHMQTVTPLTISSTDIRNKTAQQQSIRYLTPESVINTIQQQQFYTA